MAEQNHTVYYIGNRRTSDHSETIEELDKVGATLVPLPMLEDEDEIIEQTQGADALIVVEAPITRKVLESLTQCKAILRTGVGFDCIDVDAATDNGIAVINVPDLWTREVANHAITLLLAANRKIVGLDGDVRADRWTPTITPPVGPLHTETVGVVGLGRIGSAFARRITGFEVELVAHDPYISDAEFDAVGARSVSLDELLAISDYISVHTPLNDETYHLINEEALRKMKPTAHLINTSRGPVVDEQALIKALQEGWIVGAGLDVLEKEPPDADNPLLKMNNVTVTPHAAHYSDLSMALRPRRYGLEIAAVLDERKPMNLVNPQVLEVLPLK
ncbi:MAG: C-terminal binding protein [SAR202 cluster bacterium]|jgi:D-3-phosphoglycerate dehydrogenase|nr:C-terminal binding protein [SAR202 cluster bacterium]MDP6300446.1 C-terminal binding protein [SAR202 cluster bacterium]MDP7102130.1 C-terminal binding protein [SAR202 cluster bacterium]MDP7224079.1 C-terminal binding protein [SAR202 cluster bacterium]|tara:strand:- start:499 stop:1497 length:999 start_codon:yes stop_codon:yes gene_type:complete